jgi:hypothetical protein
MGQFISANTSIAGYTRLPLQRIDVDLSTFE